MSVLFGNIFFFSRMKYENSRNIPRQMMYRLLFCCGSVHNQDCSDNYLDGHTVYAVGLRLLVPKCVRHGPWREAETSQASYVILAKSLLPYGTYRILALIGSHSHWPSRSGEPPVENVWEQLSTKSLASLGSFNSSLVGATFL